MDQSFGAILFATAVIGNLALIVLGVVCTMGISLYRGHVAARERRAAVRRRHAAFHHPDPVRTPLFEWIFMLGATAAVLVGLPVILAATFRYVVPMLGRGWAP